MFYLSCDIATEYLSKVGTSNRLVIRLIGFGGREYYSKVLPPDISLTVRDVCGDKVLASFRSCEGWDVTLELQRSIIHVTLSPTILSTAQSHLCTQFQFVRKLTAFKYVERLYFALPSCRRNQMWQLLSYIEQSGNSDLLDFWY